ncbi:hypothetical protein ZIOFF_062711 [Zingiber officinale]|uniref:Uncharacterized protein n=1 Tax=Zingiber officinale TaxID=94328 RepID=A0A8J5KFK7_ZINOF|nr:hypothetical protein ZIOFF_062711 [Zingiber officinale]
MMPLYHQHPDSLPQLATRALQTPHTTGLLNSFGSFPHRRSISPDLCSVLPHNRAGSLLGVIVRSGQCHPITVLSSTLAHYYGGISILFERNLWISWLFLISTISSSFGFLLKSSYVPSSVIAATFSRFGAFDLQWLSSFSKGYQDENKLKRRGGLVAAPLLPLSPLKPKASKAFKEGLENQDLNQVEH